MSKRIVIVGAGPAGCYAGQLLKIYGLKPLLIEEHPEVGKPIHCTGIIGGRIFKEKSLFPIPRGSTINVINGAFIHYDREEFDISRKEVAYIVDREDFDKGLSKGLDILFENRFLGFERNKRGYIVQTDKEEIGADIIIGADGANSLLRKVMNSERNIRSYRGLQFKMKFKPRRKDFVEVFLKKDSFLWIVPEREGIVRVGTISENPHRDLSNFIKDRGIKGEPIGKFGGLASVGICENTIKDNIALVGDAACQMKPLSYGGVYFGLRCASILASCIKEGRIDDYDRLWKQAFASEIRIGLKAKGIYSKLNKEEVGDIFYFLKDQRAIIERKGDFENHGQLILEIIRKPSNFPQITTLLKMLIRNII